MDLRHTTLLRNYGLASMGWECYFEDTEGLDLHVVDIPYCRGSKTVSQKYSSSGNSITSTSGPMAKCSVDRSDGVAWVSSVTARAAPQSWGARSPCISLRGINGVYSAVWLFLIRIYKRRRQRKNVPGHPRTCMWCDEARLNKQPISSFLVHVLEPCPPDPLFQCPIPKNL